MPVAWSFCYFKEKIGTTCLKKSGHFAGQGVKKMKLKPPRSCRDLAALPGGDAGVYAQSIVGKWKSIDDDSNKPNR